MHPSTRPAADRRASNGRWIRAPLLAWLVGLALLCEGGLRAAGFEHVPPSLESAPTWDPALDPLFPSGDGLHALDALQWWSPMPGAPISAGGEERVNASGYRGPELPRWKTPGVLRIALLGDGATFAAQVTWSQTYAALLVAHTSEPAEVLDAAVIGFTVVQGIGRYSQLVRAHHPDVVVIAFGGVEEARPTSALDDRSKLTLLGQRSSNWPWTSRRSSLDLRSVQALLWLAEGAKDHSAALARLSAYQAKHRERLAAATEGSGAVEWPGERRVSVWLYDSDLQRLIEILREDGARAVLIAMPRDEASERAAPVLSGYSDALQAVGQRFGVPVCDARGAFREAIAQGAQERELFLDGVHLTPLGHALLAERLARTIETHGAR